MARRIRFLLTVAKPTGSVTGSTYRFICRVGEFDPAEWKSEAHMRRYFRDLCRRHNSEAYADKTKRIEREEALS